MEPVEKGVTNQQKETKGKRLSLARHPFLAHLARISVSIFFFWAVSRRVSWDSLWDTIIGVEPFFFALSCLTLLVNPWFLAKKFESLISSFSESPGLWSLLRINLICLFYSIIIPTGVGVGVLRWYQMGQLGLDKVGVSAVVVMERLLYLAITVFFVLLSLAFSGDLAVEVFRQTLIPVSVLAGGGVSIMICLLAVARFNRLALVVLDWVESTKGLASNRITLLRSFSSRFVGRWKELARAGCWGIAWQAMYCFRIYMIFLSLQIPMRIETIVWVASLILLLQVLPISYLGLGIRESAYAFIFVQYGLPPEQGVSVGLLSFLQMVFAGLLGWFLVLKDSLAKRGRVR